MLLQREGHDSSGGQAPRADPRACHIHALRAFRPLDERGRGSVGGSVVIDEGGACVEKEVVQSLPGRSGQTDLIHRCPHQFQPAIPDLRCNSVPRVVEPKVSMTLPLLDIAVGSSESKNEIIRHPTLGESPPLLDIEPPHDIIGRDPAIKSGGKCGKSFLAEFFEWFVHFSGLYHRSRRRERFYSAFQFLYPLPILLL